MGMQDPLISQVDVRPVEGQSSAVNGINALKRFLPAFGTIICLEPVTETSCSQFERLRLVAVVKVVDAFNWKGSIGCEPGTEYEAERNSEQQEEVTASKLMHNVIKAELLVTRWCGSREVQIPWLPDSATLELIASNGLTPI